MTAAEEPRAYRPEDAHTANVIAKALADHIGYLRLSDRYRIAHDAIEQARAVALPRWPE